MDVMLVIDASSSMSESTITGRSKLAAATDAAHIFVDQLHFATGDQAGVVSFNAIATLLAPLSSDRSVIDAALAGLATAQYTRLDLGISGARSELLGPHRNRDNRSVMIVLTDGRANPVPVDVAEAEAQEAKDAGVTIFTVGLGQDLDFMALEAMASRPEFFYNAPDGESLSQIYRGIAVAIPCPSSSFWGQR
jgi:Ca-activated chloride channel family protein